MSIPSKEQTRAWSQAVDIEKNATRNRWLLVKQLVGELYPLERLEALRLIEKNSKRITQEQRLKLESIIDSDDFITVVPL